MNICIYIYIHRRYRHITHIFVDTHFSPSRLFWQRCAKVEHGPPMSGYDLICHVPLGIDGFSDSFCVALAAYDAKTDTIVILDASETCRQSSEVRVDETNGPGLSIDSMSWRAGPD